MVITLVALLLFAGLFLGVFILVVFMAINAKTTGGRVAAIVGGVAVFLVVPLVFVMLSLVTYRMAPQEATVTVEHSPRAMTSSESVGQASSSQPVGASIPNTSVPNIIIERESPLPAGDKQAVGVWRSSDTDTLTANIYPSFDAAIKPMIGNLRETLIERQTLYLDENDEVIKPDTIVVTAFGSNVEPLLPQIAHLIGKQFPGTAVRSQGKVPPEPTKNQLSVHFVVDDGRLQEAPWDRESTVESGQLSCIVQASLRQTVIHSFVSEKPWVETLDRFVSQYPTRNFIVGYSGELQSTESQARKVALSDASRQAAISVNGSSYAIIDERHVVDRFAQQLSRSYGDVWREAVLVEIPDANQISMARATAAQEFQRSALMGVSKHIGIAILVITTILLCLLLNWVTKGYYRSQVLLGLTGVIIFGLLIVGIFVA